ncbi:formate dehydrogenase subunit alpha [Rhodoferax sp.]|uniref:formate dehydrogenase subunit alpha n=1 Tax=Rhodoferax sp. TaxID=50421 RepID=UPI002631D5EA|nr:formate dehydrogenase subunit alpha [Rhodoferax sp.]MDD2808680.1 formate dehydrogenase subunit alpha [Rhodoferax sp.]
MSGVTIELDGRKVQVQPGLSILQAAANCGVDIPHLCTCDGLRTEGNCRSCLVEVQGERNLVPSCSRSVKPGMVVQVNSPRAVKNRALVLELMLSDLPEGGDYGELSAAAKQAGVTVRPALRQISPHPNPPPAGEGADSHNSIAMTPTGMTPSPSGGGLGWGLAHDASHPAMLVNLDACIQCTRCVRACREAQVNGVIGLAGRGADTRIVFDLADPMGASSCVACGECVQACPTGAISARPLATFAADAPPAAETTVDSVCPYCGVGCLLTYHVKANHIVRVDGRDGPANHGRLCVKGRYGFDYIHHPHRLTQPLIRRSDVPKDVNVSRNPDDWAQVFRPATWDEALAFAAGGLKTLRDTRGPKALAGFGSAKGSNEEAYLFQKLVRTGFGSNNVDHCTRLCHASSVAALLEGLGSGAVSNQINDVAHADFCLVIGSNTAGNHPVAATWIKNAVQRGLRLVVADPRGTDLDQHAWRTLRFKPDTDVALINAMLYTVFEEDLVAHDFIAHRVDNAQAVRAAVQPFSPEAMAPVCGMPAATIREVARAYANAKSAMIFWGMGVSQHTHGTDNVRALIALCMVCGQIGKPGSGLHPLRGQNNVQGASDAGLLPMMFPNYQRVSDAQAHAWFETFWGTSLDPEPGLTVVEIMHKALAPDADPHKVRGMFIQGENPAMSDPDLNHARQALASLQHLVVQDIFLTETAWLADVVLPATAWPEKTGTVSNTDRMIQMGRQAINPPGDARADLWIIQQMAQRMGLNWHYAGDHHGVAEVYEEMRQTMPAVLGGVSWQRLQEESSVTYPCPRADDPGQPTVFIDRFPTANGRAQLVPTTLTAEHEQPDPDFPLVLITGRLLEHWHTGSMTRRSHVLDALEPIAMASVNARELARLGLKAGDMARLRTRRGQIDVMLRCDEGTPDGAVFMPFAFVEAAANLLTNPLLDPVGKIPAFKYCAVALEAVVHTS